MRRYRQRITVATKTLRSEDCPALAQFPHEWPLRWWRRKQIVEEYFGSVSDETGLDSSKGRGSGQGPPDRVPNPLVNACYVALLDLFLG
jgi:hypothetical protein